MSAIVQIKVYQKIHRLLPKKVSRRWLVHMWNMPGGFGDMEGRWNNR